MEIRKDSMERLKTPWEMALNYRFTFGKFKRKSIYEILGQDIEDQIMPLLNYMEWAWDNTTQLCNDDDIIRALIAKAEEIQDLIPEEHLMTKEQKEARKRDEWSEATESDIY